MKRFLGKKSKATKETQQQAAASKNSSDTGQNTNIDSSNNNAAVLQSLNCDNKYQNVKEKDLPNKLHKAAWLGDYKKIKSLSKEISSELKLYNSGKCCNNRTALHYACSAGHKDFVRDLLKYSTQVPLDLLDSENRSALFRAIEGNHLECVQMLIQYKPVISFDDMELAIKNNYFEIAILLSKCGSLNDGQTVLHNSARDGRLDLLESLIAADLDLSLDVVNFKKQTPLMLACEAGQEDIVKLLCTSGADPLREDVDGHSAVDYARNIPNLQQYFRTSIVHPSAKDVVHDDGEDTSWKSESESVAKPKEALIEDEDSVISLDNVSYLSHSNSENPLDNLLIDNKFDSDTEEDLNTIKADENPKLLSKDKSKDDDESDWSASISHQELQAKPKLNLKQAALNYGIFTDENQDAKKAAKLDEQIDDGDDDTIASDLPALTPRSGKGTPRDRKVSFERQESDWDSESELPTLHDDTFKSVQRQESDWDDDTILSDIPPVESKTSVKPTLDEDLDEEPLNGAEDELKGDALQPIEEENSWKSEKSDEIRKQKGDAKSSFAHQASKEDSDWDSSVSEELPVTEKVASPISQKKYDSPSVSPVLTDKDIDGLDSQRSYDGVDNLSVGLGAKNNPKERREKASRDLHSLRRSSYGESDTTSLTGAADKDRSDEKALLTPVGSYLHGVVGQTELHADLDDEDSEASLSGTTEFSGKSKIDLIQIIRKLKERIDHLENEAKSQKRETADIRLLNRDLNDRLEATQKDYNEEYLKTSALESRIDNLREQLAIHDKEKQSEILKRQNLENQSRSNSLEVEASKHAYDRIQKEVVDLRKHLEEEQELRRNADDEVKKLMTKLSDSQVEVERLQKSMEQSNDPERLLDDQYDRLKSSSATNLSTELKTLRDDYETLRSKYQDERKQWLTEKDDMTEKLQVALNDAKMIQDAMDKVSLQNLGLTEQCRNLENALESEKQENQKQNAKVSRLTDELAHLSDAHSVNERNWNEWADKLEDREEKLRELNSTNRDLQDRIQIAESRVHDVETELQKSEQKSRDSASSLEEANKKLNYSLEQLQETQGEIHLLKEEEAKLVATNDGLQAQLSSALSTNQSMKSQLEKLVDSMSKGDDKHSDILNRLCNMLNTMRTDFDKSKLNLEKEKIALQHEVSFARNGDVHGSRSGTHSRGDSSNQLDAIVERLEKVEAQKQATDTKLTSWKQDEYEDRIRHQEVKNTRLEIGLENERKKSRDLGKTIVDLEESSADELRRYCSDVLSERDRLFQDSQHYKEMYNQEKRFRQKLADELERAMNSQAHAQAHLSLEQDRSRFGSHLPSGHLSSQNIPGHYASQQSLFSGQADPFLQQRLRSELDRSIAKHLESDDRLANASLAASRSKSINNISGDLDLTYLTYLKKKYLV